MTGWTPKDGDIGEPLRTRELEPAVVPVEIPQPQEVPSR